MDALQAGCHVFIEKPLSTNVQEAADIVAPGARAKPQGRCRPPVPSPAEPGRGAATTRGRGDRAAPAGDGDPGATLAGSAPWGRELVAVRPPGPRWRHPRRCGRPPDRRLALDHRPGGRRGGGRAEPGRVGARHRDGRRDPAGRRHPRDPGRRRRHARNSFRADLLRRTGAPPRLREQPCRRARQPPRLRRCPCPSRPRASTPTSWRPSSPMPRSAARPTRPWIPSVSSRPSPARRRPARLSDSPDPRPRRIVVEESVVASISTLDKLRSR